MNESNAPKPKLRWYQFSLRTLLIFTLLAAIGFSLLGQRIERIRSEIRATAELKRSGARIEFHSKETRKNVLSISDRWLWKCFDDSPVHSVTLVWNPVTAIHLEGLTSLERLYLKGTQVTDAGLKHLEGMTNLELLCLNDTQVTDVGLEHLKGLASLQDLALQDTQVTDSGLEYLKDLTSLQAINLNGTRVTDAGLEYLKGLTNLEWLHLNDTQVTDAGLKKIQIAMPKCRIYKNYCRYQIPDE